MRLFVLGRHWPRALGSESGSAGDALPATLETAWTRSPAFSHVREPAAILGLWLYTSRVCSPVFAQIGIIFGIIWQRCQTRHRRWSELSLDHDTHPVHV